MKRIIQLFKESDTLIHKMFWDSFFIMLSTQLTVAVSNIIDGLMVSNFLGQEMFAAQSLSAPYFTLIAIISNLLATGTLITVSKSIVKKHFTDADNAFTLVIIVGLIISVIIAGGCFLFIDSIPRIFGVTSEKTIIFEATKEYLLGLSIGTVPLVLRAIMRPILQINGDKFRAKYTVFLIAGINCLGNALAIFVFDLGIFGVGLSTSIAQWIGFFIYLLHFKKEKIMCRFLLRGIRIGLIKNILVCGLPRTTSRVCVTLRFLLINRWVIFLGAGTAMSAVGINNNVIGFSSVFESAIALAIVPIAGTFYEEHDKSSLNKLIRISMVYNLLINFALSVAMYIFAPFLASVYAKAGTEVYNMAITCLRWSAVGVLFYAVNNYFTNLMLSVGKYKQVHVFTIFKTLIYTVLCAYILGLLFGIEGVFASFSIAEIFSTVHILISVWVKNRKFPRKPDDFMMLPDHFGIAPEMTLDLSVSSRADAIEASRKAVDFCKERGVDVRRAFFAALCIEEMASNVVQHGFTPGKAQSLMIRILYVNDDVIMRFRDSCKQFNIREQYDMADKSDLTKNIGIRIVMNMSKDVSYVNILNLNTTIIKI